MKRLVIVLALLCAALGGALCSDLVAAKDPPAPVARDERIARALETIAKEFETGNNLCWGHLRVSPSRKKGGGRVLHPAPR